MAIFKEDEGLIVVCLDVVMKESAKKVNKCFQIVFKIDLGFRMKNVITCRIPM